MIDRLRDTNDNIVCHLHFTECGKRRSVICRFLIRDGLSDPETCTRPSEELRRSRLEDSVKYTADDTPSSDEAVAPSRRDPIEIGRAPKRSISLGATGDRVG